MTVACCALVRVVVGELYTTNGPVEPLMEPGPVRVHETPLEDMSFITVTVIATV